MASICTLSFLKSRLDAKSRLVNVKFHFGHDILYLKLRLYVKSRFVKSRLYCSSSSQASRGKAENVFYLAKDSLSHFVLHTYLFQDACMRVYRMMLPPFPT